MVISAVIINNLSAFGQLKTNKKNKIIMEQTSKFEFRPLPYAYDALEPYIDKMTMEIHYSRHHKTYYDNFIKAISGSELENLSMEDIFQNISKYSAAVRNNGGGYYNHELFWENMIAGESPMSEQMKLLLEKSFGSIDYMKESFSNAALTRFGSGWAWLCLDSSGNLFITSTPNQDNPLMDVADKKGIPLLALDVW